MNLVELLACPSCLGDLCPEGPELVCTSGSCRRRYPVVDGAPALFVGANGRENSPAEGLDVRVGYYSIIHQMIDSLTPDQVVLDIGVGYWGTDDPRVIRMDVAPTRPSISSARPTRFRFGAAASISCTPQESSRISPAPGSPPTRSEES